MRRCSKIGLFAFIFTVLAAWLAERSAHAQNLEPPKTIDPNAPGSPNAPGAPPGQPAYGDSTEYDLQEAEAEDSGRGLEFFYANVAGGVQYVNMTGFSTDNLALEKTSSFAPTFDFGLGLRLLILSFGPRMRFMSLPSLDLWQLGGDVTLHVPMGRLDIGLGGHAGYAFVGALGGDAFRSPDAAAQESNVSVTGFGAGLHFSGDYYVTNAFSVGGEFMFDGLFLKRPVPPIPASVPAAQRAQLEADPLYQNAGSSAGFGTGLILRLGLHL